MATFTTYELTRIKEVEDGELDYDALGQELQDKLYEHFMPDMPYGTAKARDGDPEQFILDHLQELLV